MNLLYGEWPKNYDEVVLVLDQNNEISTSTLYEIGLLPAAEYEEIMEQLNNGETVENQEHSWSYEEICSKEFYLIPECDYYQEQENGTFQNISDDRAGIGRIDR